MRLLYTKRRANFPEGFAVRNPHYFVKPETGVRLVAVEGSYPEIAEAYQKLGVSVEAFGDQLEAVEVPESTISEQNKADAETVAVGQADIKDPYDMTVDELQAYLNELGVEFDSKAKKADLLKLAKE